MKNLLIASLASMTFAAIGAAQIVDPPTTDKEQSPTTSSVTIKAWDSECTFFRLANHDAIFIQCFQGTNQVLDTRVYPFVGTPVTGGLILPKASYVWTFSQGPPNHFSYMIVTNTPTTVGATTTGAF
jgi:hypothetical protein